MSQAISCRRWTCLMIALSLGLGFSSAMIQFFMGEQR
jgi:hypothetical protein